MRLKKSRACSTIECADCLTRYINCPPAEPGPTSSILWTGKRNDVDTHLCDPCFQKVLHDPKRTETWEGTYVVRE